MDDMIEKDWVVGMVTTTHWIFTVEDEVRLEDVVERQESWLDWKESNDDAKDSTKPEPDTVESRLRRLSVASLD